MSILEEIGNAAVYSTLGYLIGYFVYSLFLKDYFNKKWEKQYRESIPYYFRKDKEKEQE